MKRAEMLDAVKTIVTKDRQADHGKPEDSFADICNLWSAYLGHKLTSADVANMMILLKIARAKSNPGHQDNWVDMAGYAACGCEIATGGGKPEEKSSTVEQQLDTLKEIQASTATIAKSSPVLSDPDVVTSVRRCPYQERYGYNNWLRCTLPDNHEGDHQIPAMPENMKCD